MPSLRCSLLLAACALLAVASVQGALACVAARAPPPPLHRPAGEGARFFLR